MRRFLAGQARQEALHAAVFQGAIAWLAPRHLSACPLLPALERYRALIEDAIRRGRFLETVLAEQVILEGLGEAILGRIEAGLVKRKAGFSRLRRILLHQEEAHHDFGCHAQRFVRVHRRRSFGLCFGCQALSTSLACPMISVIIPALNEEKALPETLRHLLKK